MVSSHPSNDSKSFLIGNVEKVCPESGRRAASGVPGFAGAARQTWGRPFAAFGLTDLSLFAAFALTYEAYAPGVKTAAAFPSTPLRTELDGPFGQHRIFRTFPRVVRQIASMVFICHVA